MEAEKTILVKRNEALIKFSKEHHYGLLLGWEVKLGLKNNVDLKRIANYILFFYDNDLAGHFAEEERVLFSKLSDTDILKQQALSEHNRIYRLIENIRQENFDEKTLLAFADDLENHIRFEERMLFNHIQQTLSDDEFQDVLINHTRTTIDVDAEWKDRFWEG